MAYNLISGKIEPGDWSCGAADADVNMETEKRARTLTMKNAAIGFALGALAGYGYLQWENFRDSTPRGHLPEET
jgi:hypothetical protein